MIMSYIWTAFAILSLASSLITGQGSALAPAVLSGAQAGVQLAISMAGALCLWTGVNRLMEKVGITDTLARLLRPLLSRIFPGTAANPGLARDLSANVCANFLGLGNAATPLGISAVQRMKQLSGTTTASDEMCRLIVLNTASIQLIPTNVAAVRSALGCATPFDILPMVWITSLCSASAGLCAAWFLGKVWRK